MDLTENTGSPITWLLGILMGLIAFFGRRELKQIDRKLEEHDKQLDQLRENRVTRADIDELRASTVASIRNCFNEMESRVKERHQENIRRADSQDIALKEIRDYMWSVKR